MLQRAFIESAVSPHGFDAVSDLPPCDEPVCDKPGRTAISSLVWLDGMTRPDIANESRPLALQAHDPAERDW